MTPKRLSFILTGLLIVIIGAGALLTVYASLWLTKRSENIVNLKLDIASLEATRTASAKASNELQKNAELVEIVNKIIPKSKDQAKAIAEFQRIASDLGISIGSISFPTSELGGVAKTTTPAQSSTNSSQQSTTPSSAPSTSTVTQAKPVDGLTGILGVEINISSINKKGSDASNDITYDQLIGLLEGLERNRRTMQIRSVNITPLADSKGNVTYSVSIVLNIYVKS